MKDRFGFAKNLSTLLKALEMSQTELARRAGLTPAAISQLLSGEREPALGTLVAILRVIPVSFERLVNIEGRP